MNSQSRRLLSGCKSWVQAVAHRASNGVMFSLLSNSIHQRLAADQAGNDALILLVLLYCAPRFPSMVTHELTFYLAAAALLVLTVESCVKLLNGDSFGIAVAVYVTVFAWYFVDPFLNPEQYEYLPSFLLGQSYGQVCLFLIGFRVFMPVAVRWIVRRRSTRGVPHAEVHP